MRKWLQILKDVGSRDASTCLVMPIETLMTFNRLKQLTTDANVVIDAIKSSDKLTVGSSGFVFPSLIVITQKLKAI